MKLSVGPILYLWPRKQALDFYAALCEAPVDIVYLGEVVCSKRRLLQRSDWIEVVRALRNSGKEVVFSTLALIEAESELAALSRIVRESDGLVEANDFAAVEALEGRAFVAGPHLNVYNPAALAVLARRGARRWAAPVEAPLQNIASLAASRPTGLEVEMFAYGRLPLAFSARCFTARAQQRSKDDCEFVCGAHPDGVTLYTREDRPFLCLNGVQTQSAAVQNLLSAVPSLRAAGVDIVRLSPQSRGFFEVVRAFRDAVNGLEATAPAPFLPGGYCAGYLRGAAGLDPEPP
jgi:O2-independent ubiquinone biosynthesis protein UbiV